MPLSKASIEGLLRTKLFEVGRNKNFVNMTGPVLQDGIILSELNLMLKSSPSLRNMGAFAMELIGACL